MPTSKFSTFCKGMDQSFIEIENEGFLGGFERDQGSWDELNCCFGGHLDGCVGCLGGHGGCSWGGG